MNQSSKKFSSANDNKRILNEIKAKVLNEQNSDRVIELRKGSKLSTYSEMLFGCECDAKSCPETISLSTHEYAEMHRKNMHFIVIPSHVHLDIEEVIATFKNYSVVRKLFPVLKPI